MKKEKERNVGGSVDRISELPECIIHQIMSHLRSKEVARTSVLSKTWYLYKRSYPVLKFKLEQDNLVQIRQTVYDSLNRFSSNKLPLRAFSLSMRIVGRPDLISDLDRWILLALENGAKELNLCANYLELYTLPEPVFCSKTLTILELTYCVLDLPISTFGSLKKLDLSDCILEGSLILKDADCPLLEELSVKRCRGEDYKSISISSLLQLRTFVIDTYNADHNLTVEVSSQGILSLAVKSYWVRPWSNINIHGCNWLKSLYLQPGTLTDAELHSLLLNVPLLEELYLSDCRSVGSIKITNPLLKTLQICFDLVESSLLDHIEVSAPNLENFIYKSSRFSRTPRIKVADCCGCLKTLVLIRYFSADEVFHSLISRFPLLENIWLVMCNSLQRIKVPNLQLKRLHIFMCFKLKTVDVWNRNLCEFCSTYCKSKFSIADDAYASGLRVNCWVHSCSMDCFLRLEERLKSFVHLVKDEFILNEIANVGYPFKG